MSRQEHPIYGKKRAEVPMQPQIWQRLRSSRLGNEVHTMVKVAQRVENGLLELHPREAPHLGVALLHGHFPGSFWDKKGKKGQKGQKRS